MKKGFLKNLLDFCGTERSAYDRAVDAEYEPLREELTIAGLSEDVLRSMDPDDRVAALEGASLDPYDYIYLACS